jgi:carboxylesterase type B
VSVPGRTLRGMVDVVVATENGRLRGAGSDGVTVFKGIPFAAAPAGVLRFKAPAPVAGWDGVRDCLAFGSAPPQLAPAPRAPAAWFPGAGLDCLTLNVWTPDVGGSGLPVMVWIYGGLWKHGSSSMAHYDASVLAGSGAVVVTVNYRVGFEGFGHVPGAPDNRGLRDQIAALQWVQANVAGFGGDPANVTVFGQSAGAASVALLLSAPSAKGLFRRAVAQSVPGGHRTIEEAAAVTGSIARAAGVEATWAGLAGLPPEALLAVQDVPLRGRDAGLAAFGPVLDGDLVTAPPWEAIASGAGRDVDLVTGFTHEEARGQAPPPPPGVDLGEVARALGLPAAAGRAYRDAYPTWPTSDLFTVMLSDALIRIPTLRLAEAHARAGGRTWLYDLVWAGPTLGAAHGIDLPLVFGNPTSRFAARFLGSPPPDDVAPLSDRIRRSWVGFATTGDPGWPRFDDAAVVRVWDTAVRDVENPIAASRRIWETSVAD